MIEVMDISIFAALAEPTRLRIVEMLREEGRMTVGAIAERAGIRQPQASKHLQSLHEAGIVEVKAEANRRYYMLREEPFRTLEAWLERYRALWNDRFDNLEHYLKELQRTEDET